MIAQTRIHFNEKQLFQLIHQHLVAKGMNESAAVLLKEAGLPSPKPALPPALPSPFSYQRNAGPAAIRVGSSLHYTVSNCLEKLTVASLWVAIELTKCYLQPRMTASPMTNHLHRLPLSSPNLSASSSNIATPTASGSSSSQSLAVAVASPAASSEGALTPVPIKLSLSSHR